MSRLKNNEWNLRSLLTGCLLLAACIISAVFIAENPIRISNAAAYVMAIAELLGVLLLIRCHILLLAKKCTKIRYFNTACFAIALIVIPATLYYCNPDIPVAGIGLHIAQLVGKYGYICSVALCAAFLSVAIVYARRRK